MPPYNNSTKNTISSAQNIVNESTDTTPSRAITGYTSSLKKRKAFLNSKNDPTILKMI
jgi:hypothetical protein